MPKVLSPKSPRISSSALKNGKSAAVVIHPNSTNYYSNRTVDLNLQLSKQKQSAEMDIINVISLLQATRLDETDNHYIWTLNELHTVLDQIQKIEFEKVSDTKELIDLAVRTQSASIAAMAVIGAALLKNVSALVKAANERDAKLK